MKITFKLLSGQAFTIEADDNMSIGEVKQKIEQEKSYPAKGTKLIFSGKVLDDAITVKAAGIQESNFVVVALAKPKVTATKPEPVQPQPTPVEPPKPTPAPVVPTPVQPPVQPPVTSQPEQPSVQPEQPQQPAQQPPLQPSLVQGEQFQQFINQFMEMGFQKEQIEKCMRAAFNNPDRAAEYLTSGIPPELEAMFNRPAPTQQPATQQPAPQQPALQQPQQPPQQPTQPMSALGDITSLIPQFNQLRAAIQANPELLQPIMQRIAQQNPQLFQIISQNPQQFIQMLNEPLTPSPQQQQPRAPFGSPAPTSATAPRGQGAIYITQQENEAIERLCSLGFDRLTAAQAYFAFDKNEESAANFLLDGGLAGGGDDFDDADDSAQPPQ